MSDRDAELSIYSDDEFSATDVGSLMRRGHPHIVEGDEHIVTELRGFQAGTAQPVHVIDVGSGSGDLVKLIVEGIPELTATAIEPAAVPAAQARTKLAGIARASVFEGRFEDWSGRADAIVSWGSHHHLPHDYLKRVRALIGSAGLLIVGDEFAPEYLDEHDIARLRSAERVELIDGFIFDDDADIATYHARGAVTQWARELEERRRRALWAWYKFVGDFAVARGEWDVLIAELAIARNDFVTGYGGEHKTSPRLLERELELAGLRIERKLVIGEQAANLHSFVVYSCRSGT